MVRRDYILRMIEEFTRALSRITALKADQRWDEANAAIEEELKQLFGSDTAALARKSETELLALAIRGQPTQATFDRVAILVRLIYEAAEASAARGAAAESDDLYIKGLNLLLEMLVREDENRPPAFLPAIDAFLNPLQNRLPLVSRGLLMRRYEQTGEFSKAEDALFAMIEADPTNAAIIELGNSFYGRLKGQSDAALEGGNLSRQEIAEGLAELQRFTLGHN
jgi:hypothetical protein